MTFQMATVLPGLYVGNYRDSKDHTQLDKFEITHIIAIHDSPRRLLPDKHYLCVMAADTPDQNLSQYFSDCNDFIHAARLREGNVLIHCLAGMSRSVTVAVAYIMTATNLNWKEALKVVRAGRAVANPNAGFQTQLQEFEVYRLNEERRRLRERYPSSALEQLDRTKCMAALDNYKELLQNKDICEGNCSRGEQCPTGMNRYVDITGTILDKDAGVELKDMRRSDIGRGGVSYTINFPIKDFHLKRLKKLAHVAKRTDELTNDRPGITDGGQVLREDIIYYAPTTGNNQYDMFVELTKPTDIENILDHKVNNVHDSADSIKQLILLNAEIMKSKVELKLVGNELNIETINIETNENKLEDDESRKSEVDIRCP